MSTNTPASLLHLTLDALAKDIDSTGQNSNGNVAREIANQLVEQRLLLPAHKRDLETLLLAKRTERWERELNRRQMILGERCQRVNDFCQKHSWQRIKQDPELAAVFNKLMAQMDEALNRFQEFTSLG